MSIPARHLLVDPVALVDENGDPIWPGPVTEVSPPEYSFDEGAFQGDGVKTDLTADAAAVALPGEIDGSLFLGFTPILMVDAQAGGTGTASVYVSFECLRENGTEWAVMADASGAVVEYGPYVDADATANWFTLPWVAVNAKTIRALARSADTDAKVQLFASRRP